MDEILFHFSLVSTDRRLPLRHPQSRRMLPLQRVALPQLSHLAPGRATPLWLHGDSRTVVAYTVSSGVDATRSTWT
jgi:hypothetical protein